MFQPKSAHAEQKYKHKFSRVATLYLAFSADTFTIRYDSRD